MAHTQTKAEFERISEQHVNAVQEIHASKEQIEALEANIGLQEETRSNLQQQLESTAAKLKEISCLSDSKDKVIAELKEEVATLQGAEEKLKSDIDGMEKHIKTEQNDKAEM